MKIHWRKSAVHSLLSLDRWRKDIELPPIAIHLRNHITQHFLKHNFSIYVPGSAVFMERYPLELRMLLISVGTSDPYKVFYRLITQDAIEIFLVRHSRQKSLL